LKSVASDELVVLEKSNVLTNAVVSSSTEELLEYFNSTPNNYCFDLVIYNSIDAPVIHSIKTGCIKRTNDVVSVERSLVVNNSSTIAFYLVKLSGWVNQ